MIFLPFLERVTGGYQGMDMNEISYSGVIRVRGVLVDVATY